MVALDLHCGTQPSLVTRRGLRCPQACGVSIPRPRIKFTYPALKGGFLTPGSPVCVSCSVVPDSLRPHGLEPARPLCPWDSPGKNTGVDCHDLLQGIFPTQGWNPSLLHCRQILYHLSHQGSPQISLKDSSSSSFGYIPRRGIVGSPGSWDSQTWGQTGLDLLRKMLPEAVGRGC